MGKYWVNGKWCQTFKEAWEYAKRVGATTIKATDGWTPTATIAYVR